MIPPNMEPMTASELRDWLNKTYGLEPWPAQLEVNHITYANCVQSIINFLWDSENKVLNYYGTHTIAFALGPNKGIMFKNVELIIKDN